MVGSEKSAYTVLVLFKAQLGEPFLGILFFFHEFVFAKAALKRAKPALKQPNRDTKKKKLNKVKAGT